jgi:heme exporter protein C
MKKIAVPLFAGLGFAGMAFTAWKIFVDLPIDNLLLFNQKIFYWHVGHAFTLFLAVYVAGIASVAFLWKRDPRWDDVALASAEVAVLYGAVVLVTGSIWAKAAWDVWWTWENRLVMSLLLWLTLVGYVLVRRFAGAAGERLAAGLSVFAMFGVPFIYTMVKQGDRHPQAGPKGNVMTLEGDMKVVFWASVATFMFWFLALVIARVSSVRAERELHATREKGLDAGLQLGGA